MATTITQARTRPTTIITVATTILMDLIATAKIIIQETQVRPSLAFIGLGSMTHRNYISHYPSCNSSSNTLQHQ